MESIPSWFKYPHLVIFICLLFLPIFIFQVFRGVFGPNAGPKHSRNKSVVLKFSCLTKYFLCISVLLSYSYVMTTSTQSTLMWINLHNHSYSIFTPQLWCPLFASYRMFSYVTGRSLLYCYFIYRTNDIFNGTYLEFSKYSKYGLVSWIGVIILSLVIPSSYIYFKLQKWIIINDETSNGSYCKSNDYGSNYVRYLFVWGSLNDMIYSVITIFMMVSRIFLLLTDNERKKSKSKRYEYHSSKDSHHNIEPVQQNNFDSAPDSPRGMDSRVVSMSPVESTNGHQLSPLGHVRHDSPVATETNPTYTFPEIVDNNNDNMSIEKSKTKSKSKSRRLKKQVSTVSKLDAIQFHDKTHAHNKLILLISKFFILLSSVVISSQVVLILFIILRDFVLILYSLDTIINIICLWLTFNFSDDFYNKYFCGRFCTKCCFPLIKAVTLTCSQYEITYQQTHNMNNKCIGSKCCIYCKCCCFSSCRYCCCSYDTKNTPKEIYTLAKYEIELMVQSNDDKSITMSQMSKNESQKDVMMSSMDKTEKSFVE